MFFFSKILGTKIAMLNDIQISNHSSRDFTYSESDMSKVQTLGN